VSLHAQKIVNNGGRSSGLPGAAKK